MALGSAAWSDGWDPDAGEQSIGANEPDARHGRGRGRWGTRPGRPAARPRACRRWDATGPEPGRTLLALHAGRGGTGRTGALRVPVQLCTGARARRWARLPPCRP